MFPDTGLVRNPRLSLGATTGTMPETVSEREYHDPSEATVTTGTIVEEEAMLEGIMKKVLVLKEVKKL